MNEQFIYAKLESFHKTNRIPHTIFYGSVASNKEAILVKFLKMIYKSDHIFTENTMFVNCAHGKGIRFIREEIKFFAKTNSQPGISFKSIILLNADHLTIDAQSALRRCIEQYSENTRFFIVVENKHKLLNPILSRFCEIYVPDNIHKNIYNNLNIEKNQKLDTILEAYKYKNTKITQQDMVGTSNTLYSMGYSCFDLMEWVKKQDNWTELQKANIGMYFHKIRAEFRSEKLLLLVLLSFVCDYPDCDLKTMSFM